MNAEMEAKNQEYIDIAADRMTAREAEALRAELEQARAHLGNLLATIHQDGGQYQQDNGTEQAVNDAVAKWHERTRRIDELEGLLSACFKDDERVFDALIDAQNPHNGMCKAGYPDNNFPCACRYRAAVKAHYKTKDNLLAKWRPK